MTDDDNDYDEVDGIDLIESPDYDIIYKVIVIGDVGVGKTSLLRRYQNPEQEISDITSTMGVDYCAMDTIIDGLRIRVHLWDTMGQERFRTLTKNFFRRAKGVLLLFDVTKRDTFLSIDEWINNLKTFDLDKEEVLIIGNKVDLQREVSFAEGKQISASHGIKYLETSAMTGENVKECIEQLMYNIKDNCNPFLTGSTGSFCIVDCEDENIVNNLSGNKKRPSMYSCCSGFHG